MSAAGIIPATIAQLALDLKTAKIACGAVDNPALTALCAADAQAIATFVLQAKVTVTVDPGPPVDVTAVLE